MSILFFLMAFVNTIMDNLKDSLVITAVGGGTEVIPYLTGKNPFSAPRPPLGAPRSALPMPPC
jgi:hypothetical protein